MLLISAVLLARVGISIASPVVDSSVADTAVLPLSPGALNITQAQAHENVLGSYPKASIVHSNNLTSYFTTNLGEYCEIAKSFLRY